MQKNTVPVYLISSVLMFNVVMEGQARAYKGPEPHIPHQVYYSANTSDLTYTVSATTAGTGAIVSTFSLK
ncbi:MAG: hypothetical protein Q7S13_06570 [Candidatus Omnitrophota bacterium]|nr:hypothetical protein [Candidatus Omnitrophota bacterium]